jgi:hypothetical protein
MEQDALEPGKGPVLDSHSLAHLQVGPRLAGQPRSDESPESFDFRIIHRGWDSGGPDDRNHAGGLKNRQPVLGIESAKKVAWKEGQLNFLRPV